MPPHSERPSRSAKAADTWAEEVVREHPLATKQGLELFVGLLAYTGALCPKCGFGTRAVSKKWRKCKKCGTKVERRELPGPAKAISATASPYDLSGNPTKEYPGE